MPADQNATLCGLFLNPTGVGNCIDGIRSMGIGTSDVSIVLPDRSVMSAIPISGFSKDSSATSLLFFFPFYLPQQRYDLLRLISHPGHDRSSSGDSCNWHTTMFVGMAFRRAKFRQAADFVPSAENKPNSS